ncbi:hypothetical protein R2R70_21395, partial [Cobetia sp. SIMBA_158]|uniref:hypothetical protein n=1 Tax=Cobetia sp. SIMBA_158 TaxID=3081617 RepID=UPI00398097FF
LSQASTQPILLLDDKDKLSWLSDGLSVAPEWDKLQRRVVSAGRKSELLLQAAKITSDSTEKSMKINHALAMALSALSAGLLISCV